MACTSCGSGGCGTKKTDSSSKTACATGCSTGGCNKLNVFDWLSEMEGVGELYPIVEIRFKGGRKEFFRNNLGLDLTTGDAVVVEVPNGHHLGFVSLQGELVRLQMSRKNIKEDSEEVRGIYRIASEKDIEKFEEMRARELPTLFRARQIIDDLRLSMKLSDVEYQSDNTKATFYYSADERVDFRELIKVLASEFKVRVEMRQISLRQEASRLGGIGSCGRELCCATWIADFKSVSTSAARYQNLSLNPSKLSGQCGRLKCCLNYELDTYMDALRDIPNIEKPLYTEKGEAHLQKTDIFRRIMWFGYAQETTWHALSIDRVKMILELNKKGQKIAVLTEEEEALLINDEGGSLNDDLHQMDKRFAEKDRKNKRKKKRSTGKPAPANNGAKGSSTSAETVAEAATSKPETTATERPPRPERANRPERERRPDRPERERRNQGQPPSEAKMAANVEKPENEVQEVGEGVEPRTDREGRSNNNRRNRNRNRPPRPPRPEGEAQANPNAPVVPRERPVNQPRAERPEGENVGGTEEERRNRNRNNRHRNRNRGRGGNGSKPSENPSAE